MRVSSLKKELHLAIDAITDESLLNAVYVILNKSNLDYELTAAQKKELEMRLAKDEKGESPDIPWKKSIKKIREKIRK